MPLTQISLASATATDHYLDGISLNVENHSLLSVTSSVAPESENQGILVNINAESLRSSTNCHDCVVIRVRAR